MQLRASCFRAAVQPPQAACRIQGEPLAAVDVTATPALSLDLSRRAPPTPASLLHSLVRSKPVRLASHHTSVSDLVESVKSGSVSVVEVVSQTLERISTADGELGAFLAVSGDQALAAARDLDRRLAEGDETTRLLPLLGLPVAVKDNICTAGEAGTD